MLKNRWRSGESSVVLLYLRCTCCLLQTFLVLSLSPSWQVSCFVYTEYTLVAKFSIHRPTEVSLPDVHLATVSEPVSWSFECLSTSWSKVATTLISFAYSGTCARNENTELCWSQESCSPPSPALEFCRDINSCFLRMSRHVFYHKY